ncbi:MAG: DUF1553 domain-containing protein [Verrucomicrobia bacterium]|nr:DUF1553 domain-containing protein [Verrucomicrobiota bacterium]
MKNRKFRLPEFGSPFVTVLLATAVSTTFCAEPRTNETSADSILTGPVAVEIFENLPSGSEFERGDIQPSERYREQAIGFVRFPAKYSANALPLDRSTPFVIRASFNSSPMGGEYEFRLRARGAARFFVDGSQILATRPQEPNTTGDDPVPPPVESDNSPVRPVPYPHQEELATLVLDDRSHRFEMIAIIGGKGLVPTPGELSVSFNRKGELPKLLGSPDAPLLTDAGWTDYAADQTERHRSADNARRQTASAEVRRQWSEYHKGIREELKSRPGPALPSVSPATPILTEIDLFIGARLENAGANPTVLTTDFEFLRRIALDVTGTIPTVPEIRTYLEQPPGQRRHWAIEYYLEHPGWADHWVSYWQDVLAENPGILKPDLNNSGPFRWWLHQSFLDNIAFDRLVGELIQMEGSVYQGGPAAFRLATLNDAPMAAKADILAQAFLGEKLSCARCHDSPSNPHQQRDTFSLAAMLEGKPVKLPATSTVPFVEGFREPRVKVTVQPGEKIEPHWAFASLIRPTDLTDRIPLGVENKTSPLTRTRFAKLVVSPENDRFAKVIVNRVWKRYMGAGFVEPAEDWYMAVPSHPELLDYLAREFVLSGYDLKALARMIFSSHAYQRTPVASLAAVQETKDRLFEGPIRRGMSAEQLVDTLFQVSGKGFNCEELNLNPAGNRSLSQFLNLGRPARAWEFTALMNERDRPALALPVAQSIVDVLTAFGWRQSRQNPITVRRDEPSPMQCLVLANGIMGSRMARLSDDSALTRMAIDAESSEDLVERTFLRILTRTPSVEDQRAARELLEPHFKSRLLGGPAEKRERYVSDRRVSWANHLSAEATVIRMEEERQLRFGDVPTNRLTSEFRERYEDLVWSMINSPEFRLVP